MKKRVMTFLGLLVLVLLSGCDTVLKNIIKSSSQGAKAPNKITMMYSNPKAGDFAEYAMKSGSGDNSSTMNVRYEIVSADKGVTEMKFFFTGDNVLPGMSDLEYHYKTDKDGNVLSAFSLDKSTGKTTDMEIAKEGDNEYVADIKMLNKTVTLKIKGASVKAKVGIVSVKSKDTAKNDKTGITLFYTSADVKFGLVQMITVVTTMDKVDSTVYDEQTFKKWAETDKDNVQVLMNLVDYGNKKK